MSKIIKSESTDCTGMMKFIFKIKGQTKVMQGTYDKDEIELADYLCNLADSKDDTLGAFKKATTYMIVCNKYNLVPKKGTIKGMAAAIAAAALTRDTEWMQHASRKEDDDYAAIAAAYDKKVEQFDHLAEKLEKMEIMKKEIRGAMKGNGNGRV